MKEYYVKLFVLCFIFTTQPACASTKAIQATILKHFTPLIDTSRPKDQQYKSMIVAVVTPFETKIIPMGMLDDKGNTPNELTVYEIGSITKGFVGLLLAQKALKDEIDLDSEYKSQSLIKLPNYNGKSITWKHLAQHTSGLPKVPNNLKPTNPYQPYLDYGDLKLYEFLQSYQVTREPGIHFQYSNLGAGLVAYGLENKYFLPIDELLKTSFLKSLQMNNTQVLLNSSQKSRVAPVFNNGSQIETWKWNKHSVLAGGGGLKSTIHDMKTLMSTMMGLIAYDFQPIANFATQPTFEHDENSQMGLFWHKLKTENIIWHNGATYGSSSFFGYDPDNLVGVVSLSNSNVFIEKVIDGKSITSVDQRITKASIKAILDITKSLQVEKALTAFKRIEVEIENRKLLFGKKTKNSENKDWVKSKLAHMHDIDQYVRAQHSKINQLNFSENELKHFMIKLNQLVSLIDMENTKDLKKLLERHEWFTISQWGEEADKHAWLLVQHADKEPAFQKEILNTLTSLYRIGETNPSNYAYLYDRVATGEGQPQRYGTQLTCGPDGFWIFLPIEDKVNVNKRRAEVGLSAIEIYKNQFSGLCK